MNCFEITFNKYKVSTCYYEKPFKVPSGVTVYICDSYKKGSTDGDFTLHFKTINNNIVPACTPCYLESDEVKTYQFWFDETNTDKAPEPNYLWGTAKDINIFSIFPKDKYYIFSLGREKKTGKVGFYTYSGTGEIYSHKSIISAM